MTNQPAKIYILHENDTWTEPLVEQLKALSLPFECWFLDQGVLDLSLPPPPGIFYSRMSASSHTRDHRFAAEYTQLVLAWLEANDRIVLNASQALRLEVSKVAQYLALEAHGIRTPYTVAAIGREAIIEAAGHMSGAFITKHNRGGKGLGVRLFQDIADLTVYLDSDDYQTPVDGVTLVQAYILSPDAVITRCEFIGQKFLYALEIDTSDGFELCPAETCQPGDAFCPATNEARSRFRVLDEFSSPLVERYVEFMRAHDIHVAGIEFIVDHKGHAYTYDINTNTNYNAPAEAHVGHCAMRNLGQYLGTMLAIEKDRQRHAA